MRRKDLKMGDTKVLSFFRNMFMALSIIGLGVLSLTSMPLFNIAVDELVNPYASLWALVFAVISTAGYLVARHITQVRKNDWLNSNANALFENNAKEIPIFLYLRSFGFREESKYFDEIELNLSETLSNHGVFIAIGDKERTYGAAKLISSDDTWQSKAKRLMNDAKAIFFMPGPSESVQWEIGEILASDELVGKTVWIMPRGSERWHQWLARRKEAKRWGDVQHVFAQSGVTIPDYSSTGGVFVLDGCQNSADLATSDLLLDTLPKTLREQAENEVATPKPSMSFSTQLWRAISDKKAQQEQIRERLSRELSTPRF